MNHELSFFPLFLVSVLAFLIPILVSRIKVIKIPGVVLEIIVGIIIGRSVLNIIHPREYLEFLSMFGFAFLMFLSGYEIDISTISPGHAIKKKFTFKRLIRNNLILGVFLFLGTIILSSLVSIFLLKQGLIKNVALMTLILSTTSVGVVVPTLKDRNLLGDAYGQCVMVSALVSDIATMIFLTVVAFILTNNSGWSIGGVTEVLLVLVLFAAVYLFYTMGKYLIKVPIIHFIFSELAHAASQLKVRGAIAIMLAFLVLSQWLGAEFILGAFLAGLILSVFSSKSDSYLSMKLDAIGYGFFIPIFFVMVGINFRIDSIIGSKTVFILIPFLIVFAFLIKIVPSFLMIPLHGLRRSFAGGVLLSSRLSLIIAAAAIGKRLGMISESINSTIIIIAIVTSSIAPVLFNALHKVKASGGEKIIIIGAGKIGRSLAKRLSFLNREVKIIDNDHSAIEKAKRVGLPCVYGDGTYPGIYKKTKLGPNDVVVAVTGSDDVNLKACDIARRIFGVKKCVARDNNPANTEIFKSMGARPMNLVQSAAMTLENLILRPEIYELFLERGGPRGVLDVKLKNKAIVGKKLSSMPMIHPNLVFLMIRRDEDLFYPSPDFVLQWGDTVMLFGTDTALRKAEEYFS